MEELVNIENIIDALKPLTKQVKSFRKFDGITMECTKNEGTTVDKAINEMTALCTKLKLMPIATEVRKGDPDLFAVQFTELMPKYTNEQVVAMYKDTFMFLFNNIKMKDPASATKPMLIENMDSLVKHAIMIYCRSNINQYKENFDTYYTNTKYRAKINGIFLESVEEFIAGV